MKRNAVDPVPTETAVPDLAELCRIYEVGLDLIERSHDVDDLLGRVLDEYEARLCELPADALDGRAGAHEVEGQKKLRALVMFASQAAALKEKALAAAELKRRAAELETINARLAQALEDAERARSRVDGVLAALGSGVMVIDGAARLVNANAAARALVDGGQEERLVSLIRDGVPRSGEAEIHLPARPDRPARTLLATRRPMPGDETAEVVLVTDVTQRAAAMEERLRLARLADVLRTLSVLSHKINNPLTALLGRAQILSARKSDDPHVVKAAAVIEESAQRIADLIRELASVVREGRHEALDDILAMPTSMDVGEPRR